MIPANLGLRALSLIGLGFAASAFGSFNQIVVMGDSLSDMGNISAGTLGIQPGSNYFQGRFSNGPVWVELFAQSKGLPLTRSGAGGRNWAFGGASTGTGTFGVLFFQFPNVTTQVSRYLNPNPAVNASQLYVIWCGANDYFGTQTNASVPVANIEANIRTLYDRGARQFLVPNLPLLGNTPRYTGTADQALKNTLTQQHNLLLDQRIDTLRSELANLTIFEMDVATNFTAIQSNPSLFGFTNVTQAALVDGTIAPNVDEFLFFDDVHPTRIGHQLVRNLALQVTIPVSTISGQLTLGDWVGDTSTLTAEVKVLNGNQVVQTFPSVPLSATGNYTVSVQLEGNYSLSVDAGQWLRKSQSLTLDGTPKTANFSLANGDADLSGEVDAADIDVIIADFAQGAGLTDLDGSGEVDAADIDIAIANFGASDE